MNKRSTLVLLFILLLIPFINATICETYYNQTFAGSSFSCNHYEYNWDSAGNWRLYSINGSELWCNLDSSSGGGFYLRNDGQVYGTDNTFNCNFSAHISDQFMAYGIAYVGEGCSVALWFNPATFPAPYTDCSAPTVEIIQSEVKDDRYSFGFNITNSGFYSDIFCTFSLDGYSAHYTNNFSATTSFDVLFSSFSLQYTTSHLSCTYKDASNNTISFKNIEWLVWNGGRYFIYDMNYVKGRVTTIPSHLYPYTELTNIEFLILNDADLSPFGKPVYAFLTSPDNLQAKGCNIYGANINTTQRVSGGIYNMVVYLKCVNAVSVNINIAIKDASTGNLLNNVSTTIEYTGGSMVIDNINLINNLGNTELWATVSNDYEKTPIPDEVSLSCNYSIYSYLDSIWHSGSMNILRTLGDYSTLIQTDAYDTNAITSTNYTYGDPFAVYINCSAINYTMKQEGTTRWIGYKRLKTFKCYVGNGYINYETSEKGNAEHSVYFNPDYESGYYTLPTDINCILIPDNYALGISDFSQAVRMYIDRNLNSYIMSTCKDSVRIPYNLYDDRLEPYTKASLINRNDGCTAIQLSTGKYSNSLVEFNFQPTGNNSSIYTGLYTPTTADITFDMHELVTPVIGTTTLNIVNNKTTNRDIVEENDTVLCKTETVLGNSSYSFDVIQTIYDDTSGVICSAPPRSELRIGDNITYTTLLKITRDNCIFFKKNYVSGRLRCSAAVMLSTTTNYYSNYLIYKTPYYGNGTGNCTGSLCNPTQGMTDFLGGLGEWALQNPIPFMIGGLIAIVTERTWSGIIIAAFKKMIGYNDGGIK